MGYVILKVHKKADLYNTPSAKYVYKIMNSSITIQFCNCSILITFKTTIKIEIKPIYCNKHFLSLFYKGLYYTVFSRKIQDSNFI